MPKLLSSVEAACAVDDKSALPSPRRKVLRVNARWSSTRSVEETSPYSIVERSCRATDRAENGKGPREFGGCATWPRHYSVTTAERADNSVTRTWRVQEDHPEKGRKKTCWRGQAAPSCCRPSAGLKDPEHTQGPALIQLPRSSPRARCSAKDVGSVRSARQTRKERSSSNSLVQAASQQPEQVLYGIQFR